MLIKPHSRVLEYGTEYDVGIADGAIVGTLGGTPFAGIGAAAGWSFTTRLTAPTGPNVTVDDDGQDADFRTVQGALDHVMQNVAVATPATISVSDGTYRELLFERGKNNLTISGESRDGVIIQYENFEGFNGGTGGSAVTPGTVAEQPDRGQRRLHLGNNRVALFEDSEIRTLGDSRGTAASGGYVLQARTVRAADKGFVFLNSRLTQATGPAGTPVATGLTYLARSGGSASYFDNVAFINCRIDTHVATLGWAAGVNGQPAPNPATATAASGWREFGSLDLAGNPLSLAARSTSALHPDRPGSGGRLRESHADLRGVQQRCRLEPGPIGRTTGSLSRATSEALQGTDGRSSTRPSRRERTSNGLARPPRLCCS